MNKEDKYHMKKQKIMPYNFLEKYKKGTIRYWIELWKYKKWRKKLYFIRMYKKSGWIDSFTISTGGKYFEYNKGHYFIDPDMVQYDTIASKLPMLTYHENIAAPFKVSFNMKNLNDSLEQIGDTALNQMINPIAFKEFFESKVIQNVIAGGELTDKLKMMYYLIIGTLIVSAISLLLMFQQSGVLD